MTVQELRDLLEQYPYNAEVFVIRERVPGKFAGTMMDMNVSWTIDQDTGKGSVCFCPSPRGTSNK